MKVQRRAVTRFRDAGSKPVVLAALLLTASLLSSGEANAAERSRPHDSPRS
jgi:hypothetical protein